MELTLNSSVQYVPRVGPQYAKKLERLGILTVKDLLYYCPFRYNDFSHVIPTNRIKVGEQASIKGTVVSIKNIFTKNGKKLQECVIQDSAGSATIIWFNQIYLPKIIHSGDLLSVSGMVGFFGNKIVIESPDYEEIVPGLPQLHTGRIVPVYSETAGVTSKWIRSRIYFLLTQGGNLIKEYLPQQIREKYQLESLEIALHDVHFPKVIADGSTARYRLAFDELFLMQCQSHEQKRIWKETKHAFPVSSPIKLQDVFMRSLPFTLTNDQQTVVRNIYEDLDTTIPMNRLLEGDVGSGKTVVAAAAMYMVSEANLQSVLLAPTQILAEQHYVTLKRLLEPFDITVTLVTGGQKTKTKIKTDAPAMANVLVGTHALFETKVEFQKVGLVVIDEQQRFGVFQRNLIRTKGQGINTPHLLTMTATPIPRTLALTLYGNLDLSILKEMPIGRLPIKTWVIGQEKRDNAYQWIAKEIKDHDSQAFIICPFVEESESISSVKAATKEFDVLQTSVYPNFKLGLLHGKMKAKEKTAVLDAFRNKKLDILVATPVVEVGIDIPNATIMMIEGAERFGLAQLHQLRGRVGRGSKQSYCLLFSSTQETATIERIKILETVHNGPELAEYDLKLRGQGDIFGSRQHGIPTLVASSLADEHLVAQTKQAVSDLTEVDPTFGSFSLLREMLNNSTIQNVSND